MTTPAGLPSFKAPPLNEMALGVQFMPCRDYNSLMAAEVWDLFRADYPIAQEHPPLQPNFELFGLVQQPMNFGFIQGPILNRHFFVSKKEDEIIQFQSDKLYHNWRRFDNKMNIHVYPRFDHVYSKYKNGPPLRGTFDRGRSSVRMGDPQVRQLRLEPRRRDIRNRDAGEEGGGDRVGEHAGRSRKQPVTTCSDHDTLRCSSPSEPVFTAMICFA